MKKLNFLKLEKPVKYQFSNTAAIGHLVFPGLVLIHNIPRV